MTTEPKSKKTKAVQSDPDYFECGKPKKKNTNKGQRLKRSTSVGKPPKEYASVPNLPSPPSSERDTAARAYLARLGTKAGQLTWKPAFDALKALEIEPGVEITDMDKLVSVWLSLIAKDLEPKVATGILHIGQVTTVPHESIYQYVQSHYESEYHLAKGLVIEEYKSTLADMVFNQNKWQTKDIGTRSNIIMWLLARKDPTNFGYKSTTEVTGPGGGPQQTTTNVIFQLPINPRIPISAPEITSRALLPDTTAEIIEAEEVENKSRK